MGEINSAQYSSVFPRFLLSLGFHPLGEDAKSCESPWLLVETAFFTPLSVDLGESFPSSRTASAKRRNHLRGEQLQMRLRPSRRQSRRQRPGIVVGERDGVAEVPNQAYRRVGVDDLEEPALPQLVAIAQRRGKGGMSSRREPGRVLVGLIDDVVGNLGERFLGIGGDEQTPKAAGRSY